MPEDTPILERRVRPENEFVEENQVEYIWPLEEVGYESRDGRKQTAVPSEQGELLLEFIRKHLLRVQQ